MYFRFVVLQKLETDLCTTISGSSYLDYSYFSFIQPHVSRELINCTCMFSKVSCCFEQWVLFGLWSLWCWIDQNEFVDMWCCPCLFPEFLIGWDFKLDFYLHVWFRNLYLTKFEWGIFCQNIVEKRHSFKYFGCRHQTTNISYNSTLRWCLLKPACVLILLYIRFVMHAWYAFSSEKHVVLILLRNMQVYSWPVSGTIVSQLCFLLIEAGDDFYAGHAANIRQEMSHTHSNAS